MSEREAAQRMLRAKARFLDLANNADPRRNVDDFIEAGKELTAAEAALGRPRPARDLRLMVLEGVIEELDPLLQGDGVLYRDLPADVRQKVIAARQIRSEAAQALRGEKA